MTPQYALFVLNASTPSITFNATQLAAPSAAADPSLTSVQMFIGYTRIPTFVPGGSDYNGTNSVTVASPLPGSYYIVYTTGNPVNVSASVTQGKACPANFYGVNCDVQVQSVSDYVNQFNNGVIQYYAIDISKSPVASVSVAYMFPSGKSGTEVPSVFSQLGQLPIEGSQTNLINGCTRGPCNRTVTQTFNSSELNPTFRTLANANQWIVGVNAPLNNYVIWVSTSGNECVCAYNNGGSCSFDQFKDPQVCTNCFNGAEDASCYDYQSGLTTVDIVLISIGSVVAVAIIVAIGVFIYVKKCRKTDYESI